MREERIVRVSLFFRSENDTDPKYDAWRRCREIKRYKCRINDIQ